MRLYVLRYPPNLAHIDPRCGLRYQNPHHQRLVHPLLRQCQTSLKLK
ncbi:Uncharacterised protein [Vibrio cholerae]|nr:Uncharacterised protein [Vibrio cholerae]CSI64239.1 Uncharacterised protein [Vibrio cholerae]